nr:Chain C, peptide [Foot-and-mouth disease virus]6KWL_C Chain C, peptide [Foot-and-mouth disease virus]
MTAHITVPY